MPESQRIVRDGGVLFGPKQADQHVSEITKALSTTNKKMIASSYRHIVPPKGFSDVVQTLLDEGVIFNAGGNKVSVRGWNLQDFWELASWPRDSEGGANIRFGLPVVDDIESLNEQDEEDGIMISAPPMTNIDSDREDEMEDEQESTLQGKNPFVTDITTVSGLQKEILSSKRDCVLFMSAPYCRTCRYLNPAYTRMARMVTTEKENVFFAKANTAGKAGKAIGKALDVAAVPTFVMFRGGQRYGSPLAITRLPSKKLDLAVKYLTSGRKWDSTAFEDKE